MIVSRFLKSTAAISNKVLRWKRRDQIKMNGMVPSCPLWLHQNSSSFESHLISLRLCCAALVLDRIWTISPSTAHNMQHIFVGLHEKWSRKPEPNKGSIHQYGTTLVRTYLSKSCPMIQHFEFTEASLSFDWSSHTWLSWEKRWKY